MKIATWNVHRRNKKTLKGVQVLMAEHDVLCLQEINEKVLEDVLKVAPHNYVSDECTWRGGKSYIVTLSKHPITDGECIQHKHWRSLRNILKGQKEGRYFQRVDIEHKGTDWRVVNAHLPLNVSPFCRMCEWARIWGTTNKNHTRNIICGDFNTFAGPLWALFVGPFMGFRLKDLFLNERNLMQKYIERSEFVNPLKAKKRTHAQVPYQLDFLLHQTVHETKEFKRWPKRLGSDHWPLSLHVKLGD